MVDNRIYRRNNRKLHTVLFGQPHRSRQGIDALDDHADFFNSFIRLFSLTNQITSSVVAAMYAGCGHNKVAHTGKPREGLIHAAYCHAQPGNFCHTASYQCRFCIIAITQSSRNATRQCNDVLQCTAQLHTFHINVRIHTHTGVGEDVLNLLCDFEICTRGNDQRRHIQCDFLSMSRPRKGNQLNTLMCSVFLKLVLDNLAQHQQRIRLDTFAYIHDDLVIRDIGRCLTCSRTNKNGRHSKNKDLLILTDFFDAFGKTNPLRNHHTRQIRVNVRA